MSEPNMPIRGKCTWWREAPDFNDAYDIRVKKDDKRVSCSCFVEGGVWSYAARDVPRECPEFRHCRYYMKHMS